MQPFGASHERLLRLLADGHFHSGTDLAERLGVSRATIWKHVQALRGWGVDISAVSGTGYRVTDPIELLDPVRISELLNSAARDAIDELQIHTVLPSTNAWLLARAGRSGSQAPGMVCMAEMQTAGRGRLGRTWQSPLASNLYLSILWPFTNAAVIGGLSLAVGAVLVRAMEALGVRDVGLKWPNDLLWRERKLAGVLIELSGEAHGCCAVVVGVGINVRMPAVAGAEIDQPYTDLRRIIGPAPLSRNLVAAGILNELLPMLQTFERQGFAAYRDEWNRRHAFADRLVVLDLGGTQVRGRIAGVSQTGTLLLDCEDGHRREFASGDVRLRSLDP